MIKGVFPWIYNKKLDGIFILFPPFGCLGLIFLFPDVFQGDSDMSTISWVILILLIDVAHVYSTLYRTYFDKEAMQKYSKLFVYLPLIAWILFVVLYSIDYMLFWRVLAYLAVFHFIRQQYGFMKIYSRRDNPGKLKIIIDTVTIYAATVYPIIYWHFNLPRKFSWFIEGEFIQLNNFLIENFAKFIYVAILLSYIASELIIVLRKQEINIPKNLIVIGSIVSWYFGIVYFNGDMAFTTLNVISHGIPYMALIWAYGRKKYYNKTKILENSWVSGMFSFKTILVFLMSLFILAFIEEGFWDSLVWNDHSEVFSLFHQLPKINDVKILSFIVPLLALPQITHYLLDGFIWKISKDQQLKVITKFD